MGYKYLKNSILSLSSLNEQMDDFVLLESNKDALEEIYSFFAAPSDTLVISGFQGTGKTALSNYVLGSLSDDVLLFKYTMQPSTTLDDLLLKFLTDFKYFQKTSGINLPKLDTKDFREKIDLYIKSTHKPIILVLDSFENVIEENANCEAITDFVLHLSSLSEFKIIFLSRVFDSDILTSRNMSYEKIILSSVEDSLITKFLEHNQVKYTQNSVDNLIKFTRGYYQNIKNSVKLLQTLNISLDEFLSDFALKSTSFDTFLVSKIISLAPENTKDFLYLLTLLRHGITEKFILEYGLLAPKQIAFLKNINLLSFENGEFFLKSCIKEALAGEIPKLTKTKIHEFMKNTYANQLPLKPADRLLCLARSTMRGEMNYHGNFLENLKTIAAPESKKLTYLSYSRVGGINWEEKIKPAAKKQDTKFEDPKQEVIEYEGLELKPEEFDIVKEQETEEAPSFEEYSRQECPQCPPCTYNTKESIEEYLRLANEFEKDFNFCDAIYCYKQVLEHSQDDLDNQNHAGILSKVAACYSKTSQNNSAVNCYNMAYDLYTKENEPVKANYILLKLAQEYKDNFKFYFARQTLDKILNSAVENPPNVLAQAYILLADIEDITSNTTAAKELYSKALDCALRTTDLKLLSAAHFKYALLLDDTNETSPAFEHYKQCIQITSNCDVNAYLSSAYSNMAFILFEKGETAQAVEYYNLALECDIKTKNFEGQYIVYSKLAEIFLKTDKKTAHEYLIKALNCAKRSKDEFYIASAYLEIGDYHYLLRQDEKALKVYLAAHNLISENTTKENIQKIKERLNDLRIRLGTEKYKELLQKRSRQ